MTKSIMNQNVKSVNEMVDVIVNHPAKYWVGESLESACAWYLFDAVSGETHWVQGQPEHFLWDELYGRIGEYKTSSDPEKVNVIQSYLSFAREYEMEVWYCDRDSYKVKRRFIYSRFMGGWSEVITA